MQPMTGLVLWTTSEHNKTNAIQLEYSYMKYGDIVKEHGQYDWRVMDRLLERVAARKHQAIVRFYYVYPGNPTTVPNYIKALSDYHETRGNSEGKPTGFPDWSHRALQEFTLEFYEKMAERYDNDPRLAFVETGFGLWAEYHIYSGPRVIGKTFPDKAFQAAFARQLDRVFHKTPWMISVDAADDLYSPFADEEGPDAAPVRRLRRLVPVPAARASERAELERHGPRPMEAGAGRRRVQLLHGPRPEGGAGRERPARHPVRERRGRVPHHVHDRRRSAEASPDGPHQVGRPGVRLPVPDHGLRGRREAVAGDRHEPRRRRRSITTLFSRSTACAPSGRSRGSCRASRGPTRSPPAAPRPS